MKNKKSQTEKEYNEPKQIEEKKPDTVRINAIAGTLGSAIFILSIGVSILMSEIGIGGGWIMIWFTVTLLVALYLLFAIKVAQQWEKVVVLRLGKYTGLRGPGLF